MVGAQLAVVADRPIVVKADETVQVDDVLRSTSALGALATTHDATIASRSTSACMPLSPDVPTNADGTCACPGTGCPNLVDRTAEAG